MTAAEAYAKVTNVTALQVVSEPPSATVEITEPWVYRSEPDAFFGLGGGALIICAPGHVSCAYLRTLKGVRAWRAEDAH